LGEAVGLGPAARGLDSRSTALISRASARRTDLAHVPELTVDELAQKRNARLAIAVLYPAAHEEVVDPQAFDLQPVLVERPGALRAPPPRYHSLESSPRAQPRRRLCPARRCGRSSAPAPGIRQQVRECGLARLERHGAQVRIPERKQVAVPTLQRDHHGSIDKLIYVARVRNGFTPGSREALFKRFRGLERGSCPFHNLPESRKSRWGEGLTAEDMSTCRWLKPRLVAAIEFAEWTSANHLRHSKFIALGEDKNPNEVVREALAPRAS
jgi:ATP dependent DNA ligase C terminal region